METDIPYYLFVVGNEKELLGVTGLRELVCADPGQRIVDIMHSQVISIQAMEDQEEAAGVMKHYDLQALPVINQGDQLVGVISHDDILDVLVDESIAKNKDKVVEYGAEEELGQEVLRDIPADW